MVALSLFEVKEGGGPPIYKSEVDITTLYYKACTKNFPVLLCPTKLAQSTSQYYFVRQSLHIVVPSTTLYYKACTKHFPVLLCTTKLAETTSQYYFVLQCLHKVEEKQRFCSFPHRHCDVGAAKRRRQRKSRDSRRDTWAQQNEHFMPDFLQF